MVKLLSVILAIGACFMLYSFEEEEQVKRNAELSVLFDNIRSKDGKLHVFVYNYENQYPYNPYRNFEIDKSVVSDFGTLRITLPENFDLGKYAVSILDDENENEDLDRFMGLPIEGYGFSNNVSPTLSLPDYDDLLFDLNESKKTIHLTLQYLI